MARATAQTIDAAATDTSKRRQGRCTASDGPHHATTAATATAGTRPGPTRGSRGPTSVGAAIAARTAAAAKTMSCRRLTAGRTRDEERSRTSCIIGLEENRL
jgi:hypothetical protein